MATKFTNQEAQLTFSRTVCFTTFFLLLNSAAFSQGVSFEDFEKSVNKRAGTVEKFRAVLDGDDPVRSVAAMEFMLKTGDPVLVKLAKDYGLFSPDETLRRVAIKSILDAGGPLRLIFDLTKSPNEKTRGQEMARYFSYTLSAGNKTATGSYYFRKNEKVKNCWLISDHRSGCSFSQIGSTLQFGWRSLTGSVILGSDGVLRGSAVYNTNSVSIPVEIPLTD